MIDLFWLLIDGKFFLTHSFSQFWNEWSRLSSSMVFNNLLSSLSLVPSTDSRTPSSSFRLVLYFNKGWCLAMYMALSVSVECFFMPITGVRRSFSLQGLLGCCLLWNIRLFWTEEIQFDWRAWDADSLKFGSVLIKLLISTIASSLRFTCSERSSSTKISPYLICLTASSALSMSNGCFPINISMRMRPAPQMSTLSLRHRNKYIKTNYENSIRKLHLRILAILFQTLRGTVPQRSCLLGVHVKGFLLRSRYGKS